METRAFVRFVAVPHWSGGGYDPARPTKLAEAHLSLYRPGFAADPVADLGPLAATDRHGQEHRFAHAYVTGWDDNGLVRALGAPEECAA